MFRGRLKVKAAIERHLAIVCENQTNGCLPNHNGTAKHPQTRWRPKGTGAPPSRWAPPPPATLPVLPDHSETTQRSEIEGVPPGYVYIHPALLSARCFNLDTYTKNCMRVKDSIPDLLTDEGPSTC